MTQQKRKADESTERRIIKLRRLKNGKAIQHSFVPEDIFQTWPIPGLGRERGHEAMLLEDANTTTNESSTPFTAKRRNCGTKNEPTTYSTLPLELRQQILYNVFEDDMIQFERDLRVFPVAEDQWYQLQWTLGEAVKMRTRMEPVLRGVHPRVERDLEGVLRMVERDIRGMARVIVRVEEVWGYVTYPRWFARLAD